MPALKKYPDAMSVAQLSEALGIGKNSAYRLLLDGAIKYHKIGRRYLVPKQCVLDYLESARYNEAVMVGESTCQERSIL